MRLPVNGRLLGTAHISSSPRLATLVFPFGKSGGGSRAGQVIARVYGGVGNQLFIYAAARALALRTSSELWLDATSGFDYDPYGRSFALEAFTIRAGICPDSPFVSPKIGGRMLRTILRTFNGLLPFSGRSFLVEPPSNGPALLKNLHVRGTVMLEGYWQDQRYFSDFSRELTEELTFRGCREAYQSEMARIIAGCKSVSVHVRRYDDVVSGSGVATDAAARLPEAYFIAAMKTVRALVPAATFFVFSDNEPWARATFSGLDSVRVVPHDSGSGDCRDLWLMSRCQHHILSNSTFSWWGRWLRNSNGGIVVVPDAAGWQFSIPVLPIPPEWRALLV